MRSRIDWRGKRNISYKSGNFSLPCFKTLRGSWEAQREQYLLAVGLSCYKWYQSQTLCQWCWPSNAVDCEILIPVWEGNEVIPYKGVETSPVQTRFKTLWESPKKGKPKETILINRRALKLWGKFQRRESSYFGCLISFLPNGILYSKFCSLSPFLHGYQWLGFFRGVIAKVYPLSYIVLFGFRLFLLSFLSFSSSTEGGSHNPPTVEVQRPRWNLFLSSIDVGSHNSLPFGVQRSR